MKTESQTRKDLIDTKLFSAGWDVNNLAQISQEFNITDSSSNDVFEAKKTPKDVSSNWYSKRPALKK